MTVYTPEQHDLYDGRFVLSAGRVHKVFHHFFAMEVTWK